MNRIICFFFYAIYCEHHRSYCTFRTGCAYNSIQLFTRGYVLSPYCCTYSCGSDTHHTRRRDQRVFISSGAILLVNAMNFNNLSYSWCLPRSRQTDLFICFVGCAIFRVQRREAKAGLGVERPRLFCYFSTSVLVFHCFWWKI